MNDSRVMAVAMAMFVLVFGVVLVCVDDAAEGAVGDTFAVTDEHGNNIGYVITVDDDTSKEVHVKLTDEMEANIVTIPETVSYDGVQYTVTGVDYFRYSTVGTLTLPDTIKTIGYDAFWGTEFSGNLIIPGSVTSIEAYAFEDIEVTGNMSIGEPVPGETLSIASDAFYGASITGTLSLPAGVGSLEDCDVFAGLTHGGLTMASSESSRYYLENGLFIERGEDDERIIVLVDPMLTQITIPSDVTSIGEGAFYCLSNEVTSGLTIPENVREIGNYAFQSCKISGPLSLAEGLVSIGNSAFEYSEGLTGDVTIPSTVTSIGTYAFSECEGLTGVVISEGVTGIPNNMFNGCFNITSLTIPSTVTTIGSSAFRGCSSIASELYLPENLTSLGGSAFANCSSMTGTVIIPSDITSINYGVFSGCSSLTGTLEIPSTVTTIGSNAFDGCSGITSVVIRGGSNHIDSYSFANMTGVTGTLEIPASIGRVYESAFERSTFTGFSVAQGGSGGGNYYKYTVEGESLIQNYTTGSGDNTNVTRTVMAYPTGLSSDSVIIPEDVVRIGDGAFAGAEGMTGELIIPVSVVNIGYRAFADCTGIDVLKIPGRTWNSVANDAFFNINIAQDVEGTITPMEHTPGDSSIETVFNASMFTRSETPINNTWYTYDSLYYVITMDEDGRLVYGDYDYNILNSYRYFTEIEYDGKKYYSGETEWTWKTSDGNGTITAVNVGSTWSQDRVLHVVGDTGNEPLDRAKLTGFVYDGDVYSNSYWLRSQILHEVSGTIESGKQEYSISSDDMQVVFEVSSDDRYVGTIDADAGTFSVMVPDGLGGELVIEPLNRFLMTVSATGADAEVHSIQTVTSDTDGLGFIVTPWTFTLEFNPGNPTVEPTVITMDDGSPAFTTDGDTSIPVTYTQTFVYGAGGEIMPSKFLREGWGQNGWRTYDYGDSASYGWVANDGDTVDDQFYYEIDDDGDTVKVYALWVLWDSVTYERNGSFVDKEYYAPGVTVTLPSIASKVGYKDLDVTAWTETTEDQVHVTVTDGRFQMPDHSVVFSVEDVPIDYTVNYDLGGGTATGAQPTTWKYSEWQTVHPATKNGYSFLGWTLSGDDADLGETEYRDGSGANWNLGLIPGELIKNSDMESSKLVDISNMSVTDGGVVTLTASWGPIKYQVDYDLDGGTEGNLSPGEWLYGIAQSVDDPSKTGYTFVGWMVSGALNDAAISGDVLDQQSMTLVDGSAIGTNVPVIGSNGSVYMQDLCVNEGEVVTLTATWRPNTYTIEFIAGHEDATGSMEPMDMEYDTPAVLTPLGFTVAGHVFAGWSVSGLNVPYQDGASVTNLTSVDNGTVQMTAIWNAITFTIRFDKNSESATGAMSDQDFIYGTEKDLTINGYENPGYALAGWAITSDGNVIYEDGATLSTQYDATGTYTLYAVWEPVEYVIALDNGPGTGGPDGLTVTYLSTGTEYTIGVAPMEFTVPVREGYTFGGYFSDVTKVVASDGTLVRDAVGFTTSEGYWDRIVPTGETLELVAGWIPNQYDITVDSAGGVNGPIKVTATYDQTLPEFIAPSYEGYYLMGYYLQDGNDTMLIDAGGDLVANISGYTDSNGCWIRLDGASVVASWTDGATVTVNDGRAVPGTVPFGILTSSESIGLVRDGYTIDDVTSVEMGGQDLTEDQDWSFSDGELTIDSGIDVTDNIVVSAIWTVNTLTVTTNVDGTKADPGWSIIVVDDGGASLTPTSVEDGELTFSEVVLGKTYNIFYGDVETGESITIEGKDSDLTIDFYTVSYDVIDEGVSSESIVTAAVGEMPISSGTTVPGGTTVSFTAVGHGAVGAGCTYTYSWAPMGTNNVSVDHEVVTKVDVTCTVTGSDGRVPITVDLVVDGASPASMDPIDVIVRPVSGTDAILSMTSGTVSGDVAPGQYVVYLGSVDDPVAKADMPVGRTAIPESSVHGHALLEVFSVTIDGEGIEPVDVQYVGKGLTYSSVIIAEEGYRLPDSISGTMADAELATGQYAYDVDGALSVDVFGKVVIDVDAIRVWNVTVVVDPLEGATVNTPTVVDDGADLNLTITSTSDNNERYRLPDDIEVRIGGNVLPATGYTYDPTTGEVSVPDIYGDVVVTVDPVLQYMLDLSSLQTQGVVGYMYRIGDGMFMDYDGPVWIDAGSDLYILGLTEGKNYITGWGEGHEGNMLLIRGWDGNFDFTPQTAVGIMISLNILLAAEGGDLNIYDLIVFVGNQVAMLRMQTLGNDTVIASTQSSVYVAIVPAGQHDVTIEGVEGTTPLPEVNEDYEHEIIIHDVVYSTGPGYDVVGPDAVKDGVDLEFTVNIHPGYTEPTSVTVAGIVIQDDGGTYTYQMDHDDPQITNVVIEGVVPKTYDITAGIGYDGPETITHGGTLEFGVDVPDGYEKDESSFSVSVDGVPILPGTDGTYTIVGVDGPLNIGIVGIYMPFKVSLDLDGGSMDGQTVLTTGMDGRVVLPTPVRSGYTFDGWFSGSTKVTSDTVHDGDITLVAKWTSQSSSGSGGGSGSGSGGGNTPTKYTVTFDPNGGSGAPSSISKTRNTTVNLPDGPSVAPEGYLFLGWGTSVGGDVEYFAGDSYTVTKNQRLYAIWGATIDPQIDDGDRLPVSHGVGETHLELDYEGYHIEADFDGEGLVRMTDEGILAIIDNADDRGDGHHDVRLASGHLDLVISGEHLEALAYAGLHLTIVDHDATVTYTPEVLDANLSPDSEVRISVDVLADGEATEAQMEDIGDSHAITLEIWIDGVRQHELGGTAYVSFAYQHGDHEDPDRLGVFHVTDDGEVTPRDSTYDADNGMMHFSTTTHSVFFVDEHPETGSDEGGFPWWIVGAVVTAVVAFLFIMMFRNRD